MTSSSTRPVPRALPSHSVQGGLPYPMGATFDGEGVNFAVFSHHAERVELCLFSDDGRREVARFNLPDRSGDIWHGHVAGLNPGTKYGFRVHGPYAPEQGHRFNPNKLLLDPYAKQLYGKLRWSDAVAGYKVGSPRADLSFDTRDSAFAVPKAVVVDPTFFWGEDRPPLIAERDVVLYEAHVKGLTQTNPAIPEGVRGTYLGMSSEPMLDHLVKLGVTSVQIMPVHSFLDDRYLVSAGLRNYWGYQSIGFFAPEPRYMREKAVWEFQTMVRRFHAAGLEVLLDVVYNHSGEGNETGPTLIFRGLDNASYYRLEADPRYYVNDTGTGNTLDVSHPMVLRMVMDSLRYWVEVMHVDGFRFDLATTLAREDHGFDRRGGFLDALRQDPVLNRVKLIAEPWDIGPGGYQLGQFPTPFREYNDKVRDGLRRFWRGDAGLLPDLSKRLLGSAELFDHSGRPATASINFVTVHDGFTLEDVVSYTHKHNAANGEDNRDGSDSNHSDNLGVEGATEDTAIRAARDLRKRNLLASVFISQGTPMLLAGDEVGNSQGGNNNAYAQDNATGWTDWSDPDTELLAFVRRLTRLRRTHPVLRQKLFLHARARKHDGLPDVSWRLPDGGVPEASDWENPEARCLCVEIRTSSQALDFTGDDDDVFAVLNAGPEIAVHLPEARSGSVWSCILDTTRPTMPEHVIDEAIVVAPAACVLVFALVVASTQPDHIKKERLP